MSEPAFSTTIDRTNPFGLPPSYTTLEDEYAAARGGAVVIDRSARGRMCLSGEKARELLSGLVTNDVAALGVAQGLYAAALTAKGKIIADLRIYARPGGPWLDVDPLAWPGWWTTVRKYVNPRLARYEDLSSSHTTLSVYGAAATDVLSKATCLPRQSLAELPMYAQLALSDAMDPGDGFIARVPDAGVPGYDVWIPRFRGDALRKQLVSAGARAGGSQVAEVIRVEAGRPEWGIDMDDATLAQEANLDELHAISYTKGCYTGQETVARVHFRGHVNRHLRGLRLTDVRLPARGAEVIGSSEQSVGDVRSAVVSPRLGPIALAMLRREVSVGEHVRVAGVDDAEVVALPLH